MQAAVNIPRHPSAALLTFEDGTTQNFVSSTNNNGRLYLETSPERAPWELDIVLTCNATPVSYLMLQWEFTPSPNATYMGDVLQEMDGTGQWRSLDPMRRFPWYFLCRNEEVTTAMGVKCRPGAFAHWVINPRSISLILDLRCGTKGTILNGRMLRVATVICRNYTLSPRAAINSFCRQLANDPIQPPRPIYGFDTLDGYVPELTLDDVTKKANLLTDLAGDLMNPPYFVIPCGWQKSRKWPEQPCGPWNKSSFTKDGELGSIASQLNNRGLCPGITIRPLCNGDRKLPTEWRLARCPHFLDPSVPEVLNYIREDISRLRDWGFELIRHICTTRDALGVSQTLPAGAPEWSFADQSRTSAEILVDLYRAIRQAMGPALIQGDDVFGHLGAGFMHICRISHHNPNAKWINNQCTRINALAFRMGQNSNFFSIGTGAIPINEETTWRMVRQFAQFQAASGTPLMLHIHDDKLRPEAHREIKEAFFQAAMGCAQLCPTDWLNNTCPQNWEFDGTATSYDWFA